MSFEVRVPATSANLGPGFDSLALALDIHMSVCVTTDVAAPVGEVAEIDLHGGEDLVLTGMRHIARTLGRDLPAAGIRTTTDIPVARGLGSSAAAIVAGLVAGSRLIGEEGLSDEDLVAIGGELEGHADNISAAVLGGVTAAVSTPDGFLAAQLADCIAWRPVLFIPRLAAFTRDARGVLPPKVPLPDAAANVGRAALLVHALGAGSDRLLAEAMDDRLHQPYRSRLFPHLQPMIEAALGAGAAGACLSGAGPTVLALVRDAQAENVRAALSDVASRLDVAGEALVSSVAPAGVVVRALEDRAVGPAI